MRIATVSLVLILMALPALAADPCSSLLCLGGKLQGQSGGDTCQGPIDDYFSILSFGRHDTFSPSGTSQLRSNYINGCDDPGTDGVKSQISSAYGSLQYQP